VDNTRHNAAEQTALLFTHKALRFYTEYKAQATAVIQVWHMLLGPTQSLTTCCNTVHPRQNIVAVSNKSSMKHHIMFKILHNMTLSR